MAYWANQHSRFIYPFTFVACLLLLRHLPTLFPVNKQTIVCYFVLFVAAVYTIIFGVGYLATGIEPDPLHEPREAVNFIKEHNLRGPLLNTYGDGSYLTWALYPQQGIFIDGRTVNVYDSNFFWYYRHLDNDNIWNKMLSRYNFNLALLPPDSTLTEKLIKSGDWATVFFDNSTLVFLRGTDANKSMIDRYKYKLLDPTRKETVYLNTCDKPTELTILKAELQRNISELRLPLYSARVITTMAINCVQSTPADLLEARNLILSLLTELPRDGSLYQNLGTIQLKLDQNTEAEKSFRQSININKTVENMTGLGIILHNQGQYGDADKIFQQVPFIAGGDNPPPEYYQIYGRTEYQLGEFKRAVQFFHRYQDLTPQDKITPQDYVDLAQTYEAMKISTLAQFYYQQATQISPPTLTTKD